MFSPLPICDQRGVFPLYHSFYENNLQEKKIFFSNLIPHIKLDFKRTDSFSLGPDQPYTFLNSFVL